MDVEQKYQTQEGDAGQRLDVVLTHKMGQTRSYWQKQLKSGFVTLDGRVCKPGQIVEAGQTLRYDAPSAQEAPDLKVLYEDDNLLVVDKPAGLLVHPTSISRESTVSDFSAKHSADTDVARPGVVHRLDRDTSGLLVLAKTTDAKDYLQEQFKNRVVKKIYQALVVGHPDPPSAAINLPIGRSLRHPRKRAVSPLGRAAVTKYRIERQWPGYSLLSLEPQTGRTHQLRVHLSHIGHPIVGDALYGSAKGSLGLRRQFLHAAELSLTGPDGKQVQVASPLPEDLSMVLTKLDNRYTG